MYLEIAISTVLAAIFSILTCTFYLRKQRELILLELNQAADAWIQQYDATIKKAYGIIGSLGADARALRKGEQLVAEQVLESDPLLEAGLEFLNPGLREWVKEHPQQALELYPRIKQIYENLTGQQQPGSRQHPFRAEE